VIGLRLPVGPAILTPPFEEEGGGFVFDG